VDGLDVLAKLMDPLLTGGGGGGTTDTRAVTNLKLYSYTPGDQTIRLRALQPPAARGLGPVGETLTGRVLMLGPAVTLAHSSARMGQVCVCVCACLCVLVCACLCVCVSVLVCACICV